MNKKILLVIAIVAGLVAAFLVQQHVASLTGESVTVYRATKDVKVGALVGGGAEPITLPANLFPDALKEALTPEFKSYMERTPVRLPVAKGDLLLFRHFDSSIDPGVLPAIPAGKKAISISVNQTSAVAYFVQPGDFVDVMGTFVEQADARAPRQDVVTSSRPILQAVEVLATGEKYRASEVQRQEAYSTVTLLVSMEEAAKLIFAQDFYGVKFTLILRSRDDLDVPLDLPRVGVDTGNFEQIGNQRSAPASE